MSQKINPTNNKLGVLQVWNYRFQKYGKTFRNYKKFLRPKNYSFLFLKQFLYQNNLLIENVEFSKSTHQFLIKIFIFRLTQVPIRLKFQFCLKVISYWLKCPVKFLIYQKNSLSSSSLLINNYIFYLFFVRTNSIKQIFQQIFQLLEKQSNKIIFIYTIKGIQLIKFKGFKLEVTGCFESSRNQMSKTLKYNLGSVPLTRLNGYVDYSNNHFFTKFGSCGIKLWLFYELL